MRRFVRSCPGSESHDWENYASHCFLAMERFTGIALTPEIIEQVFSDGRAFTVLAPLETLLPWEAAVYGLHDDTGEGLAHYPDDPLPRRSQVERLRMMDSEAVRDLIWALATVLLEGSDRVDDPLIRECLRKRTLTEHGELVLRGVGMGLDAGAQSRWSALTIIRTATNPTRSRRWRS